MIDLGARNGCFINEELVNLPTILHHNDIIRLGQTQLKFHVHITFPHDETNTVIETPNLSASLEELEESKETLTSLVSIIIIHVNNFIELETIITPQTKFHILEDLYYNLQQYFQYSNGYLYSYTDKYLIGLWVHEHSQLKGFEGIKIINLLMNLKPIQTKLNKKYALSLPLKLKTLIHTDIYQLEEKKDFESFSIKDLFQEKYIETGLSLLEEINILDIEIAWSQKSYDNLLYFSYLKKKLHCYLVREHDPSNINKIYGIKSNIFNTISFTKSPLNFIKSLSSEIFATILNTQIGLPLNYDSFNLMINSQRYENLIVASTKINIFNAQLDSETKGNLELLLGIIQGGNQNTLKHFENSLVFFKNTDNLIYKACINYCLGSYWYTIAWQNFFKTKETLKKALFYFEECLNHFEKLKRGDRIAKMIHIVAEILIELQEWNQLKTIIQKAIPLYRQYNSAFQNSKILVYLSEMNIGHSEYLKAEKLMKKAFLILIEQQNLMEKVFLEDKIWYLFLISKIQQKLNFNEEAIKNLNRAKSNF